MRRRRRNVTIINNDIDYDKLAEAIVRANTKQQTAYSPSREWMKYILIPIFWGLALLSGLLGVGMFVTVCQNITSVFDNGIWSGISTLIIEFVITLFTIGFCVFSIVSAREIDKENDRGYIASMFSNVVAIAALIVALVALIKG